MNANLQLTPRDPSAARRQHPSFDHPGPVRIATATAEDREIIYRFRHEVYAREILQHPANLEGRLRDSLDDFNAYIVATVAGQIVGFISITPPGQPAYSIDKYLRREQLPFSFDDQLYEVRLLTVTKSHRGREIATLLMYAALRWVEARGGTRIIAMGRREEKVTSAGKIDYIFDLAGNDERQLRTLTITSLVPLAIPTLDRHIVEALVTHLNDPDEFALPYPVPSVAKREPQ